MRHPPYTLPCLVAMLVACGSSFIACAPPASESCPAGQSAVCRAHNDCRCGPNCASQDDCTGYDACIFYEVSDSTGTHRSDHGQCVSALWVFDPPPPCVPLCRTDQLCVDWNDAPTACANSCSTGADCRSGCCLTLQDGAHACAPNGTYCRNSCQPPCADTEVCVLVGSAICAARCASDSDCSAGCCVALQGGTGGACIDSTTYCGPPNPGPCTVLSCARVSYQFTPTPDAACGLFGSYDASVRNTCTRNAECTGCWWDPATQSYSICASLGSIPPNRTASINVTQCANELYPDPPVRVRCIDEYSFMYHPECLGTGPL